MQWGRRDAVADKAEQNQQKPFDFTTWISSQDDSTKAGVSAYLAAQIDEGAKGLKTALEAERANAKALDKQLKAIQSQLKEGDEASKQIDVLRSELSKANKRNAFLSSAPKDVLDIEVALTVAEAKGLIADDGAVDWDNFRTAHSILFAQQKAVETPKPSPTNAGSKTPPVLPTTQELVERMRASGNYSM